MFNVQITEEVIRKRLQSYHLGILKVTALTSKIQDFVKATYIKFKAEGE